MVAVVVPLVYVSTLILLRLCSADRLNRLGHLPLSIKPRGHLSVQISRTVSTNINYTPHQSLCIVPVGTGRQCMSLATCPAGMYEGDDYNDWSTIPTWNISYVTAMLKGRDCEFSLKGNAQMGTLTSLYDGVCPQHNDYSGAMTCYKRDQFALQPTLSFVYTNLLMGPRCDTGL